MQNHTMKKTQHKNESEYYNVAVNRVDEKERSTKSVIGLPGGNFGREHGRGGGGGGTGLPAD